MRDFRYIISLENGAQTDKQRMADGQEELKKIQEEIKRRTGRK
jgi:hypothetical protein